MTDRIEEIQQRVDKLGEGLKQAGIRLTHQRLEICREITTVDSHPDAETVYTGVRERVPTISLDTVYRTLWTLRDLGLIDTLGIPHERIRFDGNTTPHHHFICSRCGQTHDFYSDDFDRLAIPEEVMAYGTVEKTQVEIRGICLKCSKTSDSPNN
jgi:Fur family peroxide stress response transcriptional regulator